MKRKPYPRRKRTTTKSVLRLPDLEHAKAAVLNSLTSLGAQRGYRHAIDEFVDWYCSEPRLALNRIVVLRYRSHLESRQLAPGTVNLRLGAVRRLAYEAADCGLLSADLAAGIRRVKGVKKLGVRLGNWLTAEQGQALWQTPDLQPARCGSHSLAHRPGESPQSLPGLPNRSAFRHRCQLLHAWDEIRRCVTMTNQLEADLVVLTGDYVSWDPAAQEEVVQALAGLRAPYGVFGCLGNHEVITQTEESITRLFAAVGIRILRQERASIRRGEEALNLIGVDDSLVDLQAIQSLVIPKTVNILLAHNIGNDFEGAVQFGFDLILMGHTHGGQLSLEFLRRGLSFARIETPYVSGWYEKSGGQLYVNRGIGTTIIPIRVGARPEITVLELVRGG